MDNHRQRNTDLHRSAQSRHRRSREMLVAARETRIRAGRGLAFGKHANRENQLLVAELHRSGIPISDRSVIGFLMRAMSLPDSAKNRRSFGEAIRRPSAITSASSRCFLSLTMGRT